MRFARELEKARMTAGLTQAELGRLLDHKDGSVVSKYERGLMLPHTSTVAEIERVLGIEDGRLMTARYEQKTDEQQEMSSDRRSLSYGGTPLTPEQEEEVLRYVEWVRQRDRR